MFGILLSFAGEIRTIAGVGQSGFQGDDDLATQAHLNQPFGVIATDTGAILICDTENHRIRQISAESGEIETIIGSGKKGYAGDGGPPLEANLNEPYEVRKHPSGDIYWVERMSHTVRKLDIKTNQVSTIAGTGVDGFSGDGGAGDKAELHQPHSIIFNESGTQLFICDIKNHRIRVVDLQTGIIDTYLGDGTKGSGPWTAGTVQEISMKTPVNGPRALARASDGSLWLATREGNQIFHLDIKENEIRIVAGTGEKGVRGTGGPAIESKLSGPKGLAISPDDNTIYFADTESDSIRAIDLTQNTPTMRFVVGLPKNDQIPEIEAKLARPHGIGIVPSSGDLLIGDSETHQVRQVSFR